jgi:GNAT superfamily N-acetyltransferase
MRRNCTKVPAMTSSDRVEKIVSLRTHPEYASVVIDWIKGEWGLDENGLWSSSAIGEMPRVTSAIPMTWVATDLHERPLATASLVAQDHETDEFGPWLASIFTVPPARGQGCASALIRHAERYARGCGFTQILLTATLPAFYAKLGWAIEGSIVRGEPLMRKSLGRKDA